MLISKCIPLVLLYIPFEMAITNAYITVIFVRTFSDGKITNPGKWRGTNTQFKLTMRNKSVQFLHKHIKHAQTEIRLN